MDCVKQAKENGVAVAEWQQSQKNIEAALLQTNVLVDFYTMQRDEKKKELEKLQAILDPINEQIGSFDALINTTRQQSNADTHDARVEDEQVDS